MNKKQKIIVSIVGITIVALALLGITYAYYLTRIEGNTNTNSISVTTADLKLTYDDGDGSIIGDGKTLVPDNDNPVGTKVFTVTNNGNGIIEDYAVIIENFAVKYHSGANAGVVTDLVNGEDGNPDMKLVITCKSYKNYGKSGQAESGTCDGMDGFLPEKSDVLVLNTIDKEITHEYTAVLTYLEDGTNQSDDMNKTIEGRFNIIDTKNTIDVTGTVENYNPGDTVTIHSEPKESVIYTDGTYKFMGVKPDVHTIKVNGTEKGKVSIKGGTETDTTGTTTNNGSTIPEVTITDASRMLTINLKESLEITEIKDYNPFSEGTLAYNIYKNSKENKNGTRFVNTPPTKVAEKVSSSNWNLGVEENVYCDDEYIEGYAETSNILWSCYDAEENCDAVIEYTSCTDDVKGKYVWDSNSWETKYVSDCENGKIVSGKAKYEKVLSTTQDNYGTSYYFRGNVEDNYVTFSNRCWRIVRIEGDGSVKLTLESQSVCSENMTSNFSIGSTNWGYKYENNKYIGDYKNSTSGMKNLLNTWFDTNFKSNGNLTNAGLKLKDEEWCLGNITETYSYNSPYGILGTTALENYSSDTYFYYETGRNLWGRGVTPNATLKCNGEKDISKIGALTADEVVFAGGKAGYKNQGYYLQNVNYSWWTLSHSDFSSTDRVFEVQSYYGAMSNGDVKGNDNKVRPAVSLNTGVKITGGDGTKGNPYIINEG